ncbi:MAG: DUF434 domain-containing protein [Methylobacter sp.]|nr:DUF434 domain-containing protein [Methylobacter sp.]
MYTHEQRHRNAHLNDMALFNGRQLLKLQDAVYELCWLLNRGYSRNSALQLVADHHQINKLQRLVVSRAACSRVNRESRNTKCLPIEKIKDRQLIIDGFNLIITVETAMAGGLLLRCCDGCIRDIASVHGTYRQVNETRQAIELIGNAVQSFAPGSVLWLFDKPVSNSGRLSEMIRDIAEIQSWNWQAELVESPDQVISGSEKIAVTSDSAILDRTLQWVNLGAYLVATYFHDAWLIDFSNALDESGQTTP